MNDAIKPTHTEIASPSQMISVRMNAAPASNAVTIKAPYEAVRHLLSNKPLRRPNRTRLSHGQ